MKSALEIQKQILAGNLDVEEYTKQVLKSASEKNDLYNFLISLTPELAEKTASKLQDKLKKGEQRGRLFGIPIVVKDNICLKDYPTTCASKILSNFIPPYNATVIDKIVAEDAIIIGKANLDEFAMGSSNENSAFGAVKNPHDVTRAPGGSSGGSAVSVAADVVPLALGSDTGGSIRQPAAFCGVVGLKPTYGAVSRYGLTAFASSMDQIGPIGVDVESTALLFESIHGKDQRDSTSVEYDNTNILSQLSKSVSGLRVGLPDEYFADGLNSEIRSRIENVIELLKNEGVKFTTINLPHTRYAIATYYIIADAEASSNLARYDGVKYGLRKEADNLTEMYLSTRQAGFGSEVKRRIMLGTYVLSSGYYEAYYQKAQQVREIIKKDFINAFDKVDVILTPTTPSTAFKLGEKTTDPLEMYLSDIYTVSVNLAGLPAISLPCGKDAGNLPIGLQLIGKPFDESLLFRFGSAIERVL